MVMVGIMAVAALIGVLAITNQVISNRDLGHIKTVGMQDNEMQYMITPTIYTCPFRCYNLLVVLGYHR
jgi:hypothetical protein